MKINAIISHLVVLVIGAALGYLISSSNTPATPTSKSVAEKTNEEPPTGKTEEKVVVPMVPTPVTTTVPDNPEEEPGESEKPATSNAYVVINQESDNQCFSSPAQFSKQLSLFSERLEKKKLWYDSNDPAKFQDNSGIFHRVVEFAKSECNQYDYPGQENRGINIIKWYANRGGLRVIKNREDGLAQRDLIKPGAVMFFGKSGQSYSNLDVEKITVEGADRVYAHIGVVTEVRKDKNGRVEGYVMMHGRADGYVAERTHYHAIQPAGYGMPPLGNYNQQWIGIANMMLPKTDMVQVDSPPIHDDIPTAPGNTSVAQNSPGGDAFSCFSTDFDKFFLNDVAKELENEKIPYKGGPNSDCSGIVFRVCNKVYEKANDDCSGSFVTPCESGYKDSRRLARWYHEKGNLQVVTDPKKMGDLIQVGSVMFFGQNGKRYGKNITIDDLEVQGKGIQHVGVVVKVEKDDAGKVKSYHLFHGHGKVGSPADITKPLEKRNQNIKGNFEAFSYWKQEWVAVAPSILTESN